MRAASGGGVPGAAAGGCGCPNPAPARPCCLPPSAGCSRSGFEHHERSCAQGQTRVQRHRGAAPRHQRLEPCGQGAGPWAARAAGPAQGRPSRGPSTPTRAPPRLGAPRSMGSDAGMPWEWAARRGGRSQPAAEALAPSAASRPGRRPRTCRPLNPACLPLCPRQVVDAKVVVDKPARGPLKPQKVAECTVGDASGVVLLTARNEQGALRVWRRPACCCFCAAYTPGLHQCWLRQTPLH